MGHNAYSEITDRIIGMLERGIVPWRRPYRVEPARNLAGRPYRGINAILLNGTEYGNPYWGTFLQIERLGGHVRRGEHGETVVFWKIIERSKASEDSSGDGASEVADEMGERYPYARLYTVFNAAQTEGLPERFYAPSAMRPGIERAERIVDGYVTCPPIVRCSGAPNYQPLADRIEMPAMGSFDSVEDYYDSLFHEMVHSTGHVSRLGREGIESFDHFGSGRYGREELIAEMGSAMLSADAGISPSVIANQASYVGSWLRVIGGDQTLVIRAASAAQRAADYILGTAHE